MKPSPKGGGEAFLRRARFVAREFRWLSAMVDNEVFAPASSNALLRVLPAALVARQPEGWTALSLDVADAYLTVPQAVDTIVTIWVRGEQRYYKLLRNLPGQRSGAKDWFQAFQAHLIKEMAIEPLVEAPALFSIPGGSDEGHGGGGGGLCHVDDLFAVGSDPTMQRLSECVKSRYRCTTSFLRQPDDEVSFLKRRHRWVKGDVFCISPNPKHVVDLARILGVAAQRPKDSPLPTGTLPLWTQLTPLDEEKSGIYRKCIGVLLYVSSDYPAAQYAIKTLSSMCGSPNEGSWRCLRHLVNYMFFHENHVTCLRTEGKGIGLVVRDDTHTLEVFADADWSGNKSTRKSTSAGCIAFDGMVIHTFSRSQSCVSLSSGESEYIACVSATCDGILLRSALQHIMRVDVSMHLFTDSSAARGIMGRQGCGRLRHISGRLLWLQDFLFKWKKASLHAVPTLTNPADLFTKSLTGARVRTLSHILGIRDSHDGFSLVGTTEFEELQRREQAKKFLRAVRSTGRGNAEALHLLALLVQVVGNKAADDEDRAQFVPDSPASAGEDAYPWTSFAFVVTLTVCIAFMLGRASANTNFASLLEWPLVRWVRSWFRLEATEAEQPLLAEAPALAENLDTTSESSRESLGLQHYSPRTRAEILGRSPPATPSDTEHESEQPDSEPEDDDDDVYPGGHGPAYQNQAELIALYEMVGEAAAIDVMPAMQLIPAGQPAEVQQPLLQDDDILQVREDAEVWIAPVSGTRFHLIGECDGLMRARYVRRLLYRQLQLEFPGQCSMCQLCQFWARELGRRQDIARLAAMFHILHVGGQQIPNPVPQNLPEPEPHDDT